MPAPQITPTLSLFTLDSINFASSTASFATINAYWVNLSYLLTSFFSKNSNGLYPFTSHANFVLNLVASK